MLESVLCRTAAKLEASGVFDAAAIARLLKALSANRLKSMAELSAVLDEPANPAEDRTDED